MKRHFRCFGQSRGPWPHGRDSGRDDGLVDGGFDRHFRARHGQDEFVVGASYINGIESFWSFAKACLQQFKSVPKHTFLLCLKEPEFRFNHCCEDLHKLLP